MGWILEVIFVHLREFHAHHVRESVGTTRIGPNQSYESYVHIFYQLCHHQLMLEDIFVERLNLIRSTNREPI